MTHKELELQIESIAASSKIDPLSLYPNIKQLLLNLVDDTEECEWTRGGIDCDCDSCTRNSYREDLRFIIRGY